MDYASYSTMVLQCPIVLEILPLCINGINTMNCLTTHTTLHFYYFFWSMCMRRWGKRRRWFLQSQFLIDILHLWPKLRRSLQASKCHFHKKSNFSLLQLLEMMGACPTYPPLQAPDAVPWNWKQGIVSPRGTSPSQSPAQGHQSCRHRILLSPLMCKRALHQKSK